jgi:hypothetical protein
MQRVYTDKLAFVRRPVVTVALAVAVYAGAVLIFLRNEAAAWSFIDWLAVVGFPLTWLGIYLAWRHIGEIKTAADASLAAAESAKSASASADAGANAARTAAEEARDAAKAAREAIARTEEKLADQNLLMLIAQIQSVINDLDRMRDEDDLLRCASEWIDAAGQLEGILNVDGRHDELLVLLAPSITTAGRLKNAIIERTGDSHMAAMPLRAELTQVRAASSRIMGHMRAFVREDQTNG